MLNGRRAREIPPHPDDAALGLLAEGDSEDAATRAHTAGCPRCSARVAELRRIRTLVQESALREETPRRDLAGGALARLRTRHRMGSQVNEVFAGLGAFLRGLVALFAHPEADHDPQGRIDPAPRAEEEQRHD